MNLWLIGFMGSGKSSVLPYVARELDMAACDTDQLISDFTGLSVARIFEKYGEAYFRLLERQLSLQLLQLDNTVIAAGGGLPIHTLSIEQMKTTGPVIYLYADQQVIWNRIKNTSSDRPLVTAKAAFEDMWNSRKPVYAGADAQICSENDTHKTADAIVAWIRANRSARE